MTKTQKKELKARLLKILHGICYVLSAIFVLVLVIAGAKGCSKKRVNVSSSNYLSAPAQKVNVYQSSEYLSYKMVDSDDLDVDGIEELGSNQVDLEPHSISQGAYVYAIIDTDGYYLNGDNQYDILAYSLMYRELRYQSNQYIYDLYDVAIIYGDNQRLVLVDYDDEDDYVYYTNYNANYTFILKDYNAIVEKVLVGSDINNLFTFNKQFNYNAPMGISVDSPYGSGANWTTSTQYMAHLDYSVGWFISNGQLFDTIEYWCTSAGDSDFEIASGTGTTRISTGASGSWAYVWLYYVNSKTEVSVIANYRNQVAYIKDNTTNAYYYQNSSTWENDEYRYVYFLSDLSDSLSTKIQAFNNNNQYYGGSINGGSPFDVFGLVGSAFTSIIPLLSIMVLPNITLGMLLFVPLVAILVFAIIKIVKK